MPPRPVVIIPARLASTRLPEKVLLDDTGSPLILHVAAAASRAPGIARVVVATDHPRIADPLRRAGFEAVLTRDDHPNGTSRIAEAADLLGLADADVIVNVQGDEPEIDPAVIADAAHALQPRAHSPNITPNFNAGFTPDIATLVSPFAPDEDPERPHIVKAVLAPPDVPGDPHGPPAPRRALYFSRAPVPYQRSPGHAGYLKHAGLYAYRAGFVRWYAAQAPTPLELAEGLEQLRALELGRVIVAIERPAPWHGIDTRDDYDRFVQRWRGKTANP